MTEATEVDFSPLVPDEPADDQSPLLLPVRNHVEAALKAAEFARGHLEVFELILRGAPRERQAVIDCLQAAALHLRDAHESYLAAVEVASCEGQA